MKTSRLAIGAAIACLAVAAGCARNPAPAPTVTTPRNPDFMFPAAPASLAEPALVAELKRGWQFLQAGDSAGARRAFNGALRRSAGFFPAETGLAYASLADREYGDAIARFDRVLSRQSSYVPAIVGKGDALAGAGRVEDAIRSFSAALVIEPSLADVRRRLDVLKFRSQQELLATARASFESGRLDEAADAYQRAIAASPESALLYRELGLVERKQGKPQQALEHLQKAVALDPSDARSLVELGGLLEERGDFSAAVEAYLRAEALEPGDEARARTAKARARADLARLPEPYRAIPDAAQVTRGELAALIGVRLASLLEAGAGTGAVVVTDARSYWAAPWIQAVVRAGIIDAYPNHAFLPGGAVRRLDLAQAASRILLLYGAHRPSLLRQWQAARPLVADLPSGHLGYPAVAMVVGAGVMQLFGDGTFRPAGVVTGAEAMDVVARLEVLTR